MTSTLLIAGTAIPSADPATIQVTDPSNDSVLGAIPAGCPADAYAAVAAAVKATGTWAMTAPADRSALLKAAAGRARSRLEELAVLQTREGGKPIEQSRGGVEAGIGAIEQYAELGPLHRGRSLQGGWGATDLMVHEPRGVAVVLTAVERSGGDLGAAGRGEPGGRKCRGVQAVGTDAPVRRAARPDHRRRVAAGSAQRDPRRRPRRSARWWRTPTSTSSATSDRCPPGGRSPAAAPSAEPRRCSNSAARTR